MDKRTLRRIEREVLSRVHDNLYARADAIIKEYNPCGIAKRGKHTTCLRGDKSRYNALLNYGEERNLAWVADRSFCCGGCEHLSENGCTVESIACKLWLCDSVAQMPKEAALELHKVREMTSRLHLYGIRYTKKQTVRSAMLHSPTREDR